MFSSEEYDKRINGLMRRAGVLPDETDDINTATKQLQMAEEELLLLEKLDRNAKHINNLANGAITDMNRYLFAHGADNLTDFNKATLLKVISDYLRKKAWSILDSKEGNTNISECKIVESGKCAVCGEPLVKDRLFICRECQKKEDDK